MCLNIIEKIKWYAVNWLEFLIDFGYYNNLKCLIKEEEELLSE